MRAKLSKRTIDAATYQGTGACYLWDTDTAGFGLRIYPSGRKGFVVTYRVRGKQRFFTIGRYGQMTLSEARTEALETLARARRGEDPSGQRFASRRSPTIADLAKRYMEEHAAIKKKPSSVRMDRQHWDRVILPRFGTRKVADIDRADVAKLHTDLAETPSMANSVRALLSKAFNRYTTPGDWPSSPPSCLPPTSPSPRLIRPARLSRSVSVRTSPTLLPSKTAGRIISLA